MQQTTRSLVGVRTFGMGAAVLIGALSLGGCATEKYVNEHVATVDTRVSAVDTHLGDVDTRLGATDKTAQDALQRATAAGKLAEGKFDYAVVLSDDSVKFPTNAHQLSPEAQARLAELATRLKNDNKNVYLEIQGHTDSKGSPAYNEMLGQQRAEAARLFLNKQGVALNRIATISYGQDDPVAPNNTRDGRAQNRRVVIIVMS
ncbi:OmpA family protein [Phenylobacterium sp.]|uniref:OmpA family protein n=1 Tax=Phenylobacterium sp. TaxID=1871053 RepID=UPI002F410E0C